MKAYIVFFILSLIMTYFSDIAFKKNKRKLGKLFLLISLFLLCFLAGIRSEYVGRDVHNYLTYIYDDFINGNDFIFECFHSGAKNIEFLFILLVYISSFFKNIHFVFFFIQFTVCAPIYYYAYLNRKSKSITFTIFIFLTTMYCYSLSMMRQSIAISFSLLATYYFMDNQYKKGLMMILIGFLFHRTALVSLIILLICKFIFNKNTNWFYLIFLLMFGCSLFFILPTLLSIIPTKYSMYLSNSYVSSINYFSCIKKMIWFFVIMLILKVIKDKNSDNYKIMIFSLELCLFDIIFYLIGYRIPTVSRICLYFSNILYFILIPEISKYFKHKLMFKFVLCFILLFFWWHMTTGDNGADIYPYKSDIITIFNEE